MEDARPSARISVALIDSEMEVRRATELRLRAGPFDVRAFASGCAMLAKTGLPIDCVVIRDEMPEIDGFELLRRLRGRGWLGPAILVTNIPSPALAAAAADAGFATVIDRPLIDNLLWQAVDKATRATPEIAA